MKRQTVAIVAALAAPFVLLAATSFASAAETEIIRCDFQPSSAFSGRPPVNFTGVESQAAAADSVFGSSGSNTWNYLSIPPTVEYVGGGAVNPAFSNLVDSSNHATSVGISFVGTIGAADDTIDNIGSDAVENDYFVINLLPLYTSTSAQFTISGLPANTPVTMYLYAPNFTGHGSWNPYNNGDRSYYLTEANGTKINVPAGPDGNALATLTSDFSGQITGTWTTIGNEGDWSGMQLAYTVPEPSTVVLLGIGAATLFAFAWRHKRD